MISTGRKIIFFSCFLLISIASEAQMVDLARTAPYRFVFAETNAFDSSYLTQLEKKYSNTGEINCNRQQGSAFSSIRQRYWQTIQFHTIGNRIWNRISKFINSAVGRRFNCGRQ